MDSIFDKFGLKLGSGCKTQSEGIFDRYSENCELYVSTTFGWFGNFQNISINREKVVFNGEDLNFLKRNKFDFTENEIEINSALGKMQDFGDVYCFKVNVPHFTENDTIAKYNHMHGRKFKKRFGPDRHYITGTELVESEDLIDNGANNEMMFIGRVFMLVHKSKTVKRYVTCDYEGVLTELKKLE
jgi:hypothetical protein